MERENAEQRYVDEDGARVELAVYGFAERNGVREEEIEKGSGEEDRTGPRDDVGSDMAGIHGPLL